MPSFFAVLSLLLLMVPAMAAMPMLRLVRLCLLPVVAVGIPAQAIHLVGPGGLPEIGSALAIASPGDVVHVLPGTYAPFTVSIGCTIRGLTPGSVHVQDATVPASVHVAPPPGQVVHFAELAFSFPGGGNFEITGGRVTLDRCTLLSMGSVSGASLNITNADVHLQGCTVSCNHQFGFSPAVRATTARVTAIDSHFFGSPIGMGFYYSTAPGIDATNTTLHVASCSIQSGVYGVGQVPGLRANGGQVWLSDCTVAGRLACAIGGTGPVLADRCSLSPVMASCPPPPAGGLLGIERPQPLQTGAAFTLVFKTIPNSYAAVFASPELTTLTIPGLHAQTQWLGVGVFDLGAVFADSLGRATATWQLPSVPDFVDQTLWFQGVTGFAFPLQLSPVAGGLIR
ncbi:MAG: hypothetical protein KF830_09675 [Planctomycetes bacterium]|nr:hypothetical protein [Planctomycetota bacterium]